MAKIVEDIKEKKKWESPSLLNLDARNTESGSPIGADEEMEYEPETPS